VSHYVNNVKKVQGDVGVTCHLLTQKTTSIKTGFFPKILFYILFLYSLPRTTTRKKYILSEC